MLKASAQHKDLIVLLQFQIFQFAPMILCRVFNTRSPTAYFDIRNLQTARTHILQ